MPLPSLSASSAQVVDLYNTTSSGVQNTEIYYLIKLMVVALINYLFAPIMFFYSVLSGLYSSTRINTNDNFLIVKVLFYPFVYVFFSLVILGLVNIFLSLVFHQPVSEIIKTFFEFDVTQSSTNASALLKKFYDGLLVAINIMRHSILHLTAAGYLIIPLLYSSRSMQNINISIDSPIYVVFKIVGMLGAGIIVTNIYANLVNLIFFSSAPTVDKFGVINSVSRLATQILKSYVQTAYGN